MKLGGLVAAVVIHLSPREALHPSEVKNEFISAVAKNFNTLDQFNDTDMYYNIFSKGMSDYHGAKPKLEKDFFLSYQSYAAMQETLHSWSMKYPHLATFIPSIGKTHEGRDIFAFKIATRGNSKRKKAIWFNGGLHAREWIAPSATFYVIYKLLKRAKLPRIKKLLDKFDFHFTPLANPDGYEFSRMPEHRLWRKNRRNNGDGTFGVDLNRNWDEHWNSIKPSPNPNHPTYPGPHAHSEPEVRALANYSHSIPRCYGGIDFHAYGQLILRNWAWTLQPSPNENVLLELSHEMQMAFLKTGKYYSVRKMADIYYASGTLNDWMAGQRRLIAITLELCPTNTGRQLFEYPEHMILDCVKGAYAASLTFANFLVKNPDLPYNSSPAN
ncbi:hypothetical protein DSO57_1031188 [Entomophthora muscae]|uniref:Uncharacterized protein n=1 Tax=Entomophthora muscae TaxID=34485 RepID=A0ACC2T0X9_9FUNG|nr:hypothetical protein DSO57_1031188 [Entomophthora muscae]